MIERSSDPSKDDASTGWRAHGFGRSTRTRPAPDRSGSNTDALEIRCNATSLNSGSNCAQFKLGCRQNQRELSTRRRLSFHRESCDCRHALQRYTLSPDWPHRLARLGHIPLTDGTGVQIPLGSLFRLPSDETLGEFAQAPSSSLVQDTSLSRRTHGFESHWGHCFVFHRVSQSTTHHEFCREVLVLVFDL